MPMQISVITGVLQVMSASGSISALRLVALTVPHHEQVSTLSYALCSIGRRLAPCLFFKGSEPAAFRRRLGLESFNFRGLLQGQAGIVETVREAMFAERVDIEVDDAAIGAANFLGFEIDRERCIGAALGVIHELGEVYWRNNDRKNTVLEAVVIENIGKTRRDDAADSKVEERPGSMLARGAATEIIFRDKNFGFAIGRLVQDELGIFRSILLVAEFGEKAAAQAG